MTNADFSRLIRSEEIVKAVRHVKKVKKTPRVHRNPLVKPELKAKLNPYSAVLKRAALLKQRRAHKVEHPIDANIKKVGSFFELSDEYSCRDLYTAYF